MSDASVLLAVGVGMILTAAVGSYVAVSERHLVPMACPDPRLTPGAVADPDPAKAYFEAIKAELAIEYDADSALFRERDQQ
jgi:hypothetical protein